MKKVIALFVLAAVCVSLTGCGPMLPETAADGSSWSEDWVTVGSVLGVDTPEGLTPRENNEALAAKGMYYATWSMGESSAYVNEEGENAELYDAQVYVLLAGYDAAEKAEASMEKWLAMASSQYAVTQTLSETYNGQPFTILTYTYTSQTNPFARGASAFGVYRNYAISIEVSCQENFVGNELEVLMEFLKNCHYAT